MGDSYTTLTWSWITLDQPEPNWFRSNHTEGMEVASCGPYVDKGGFFFWGQQISSLIPGKDPRDHQRLWLFLFVYRSQAVTEAGSGQHSFLPSATGHWSRPPGREHPWDTKAENEISPSPGDFLLHHSASSCFMSSGSARQLFLGGSKACTGSWGPGLLRHGVCFAFNSHSRWKGRLLLNA